MSAVETLFEIPSDAYKCSNGGDVLMMQSILSSWDKQLPELQEELATTRLFQVMAPYFGVTALRSTVEAKPQLRLVEP